jgi:hypothetical protein
VLQQYGSKASTCSMWFDDEYSTCTVYHDVSSTATSTSANDHKADPVKILNACSTGVYILPLKYRYYDASSLSFELWYEQ